MPERRERMSITARAIVDPTDARRLVVEICRAHGVDHENVFGRDRRPITIAVRRVCALELLGLGMSMAAAGRVLRRHRSTVREIVGLRPLQRPGHA